MFLFEKLDVYQESLRFVESIHQLVDDFPKGNACLIDQLRRAALSIPANIAEGNGRYHVRDRRNFFWIARGSAFECVPLLELCKRRRLISDERHSELKLRLGSIGRMLSGLINSR